MDLNLEVTAVAGQPPQRPLRLQLTDGSRLLGRNTDNDLVLDDPERVVSGVHARVEAAGDAFVLIDLSTNGTFINDAPDPLPRNQPTPLRDGDLLQIGPYDIAVTIAEASSTETEQSAVQSAPPPLPGFATQMHGPSSGAVSDAADEGPRPEPEAPGEAAGEVGYAGGPQAWDEALPGLEPPGAGEDIIDLLGGAQPPDGGILERAADPFAAQPGAHDLLADPDAGEDAPAPPTPVDQVYFQPPPDASAADIPDDYDLLGDLPTGGDAQTPEDGQAPFTAAGSGLQPPASNAPQPVRRKAEPPDSVPAARAQAGITATGPARGTTPAPPPGPRASGEPTPTAAGGPSSSPGPGTDAEAWAGGGHTPRPAPGRRTSTDKPAPADDDRSSLNAFLAGLGSGDPAQIRDADAFLRDAGALLRAMVAGLSTTLMARTQFKSEMRLGVTTIRAAENNPLKFSVSVDDALERLLLRETRGYLPAQEAVKQSFEDIQAHEMAMIAGLRSALDELLARFAPAALEAELADRSLDKVLPMVRKSRCWDLLGERHAEISAAAAEDFMKVFGDAFSRAYDEQVALLARARDEHER
ncbi:MAG: type VI secretion system-associated FHA domain protein TagH [Gammaproteobacteria bacterium]|jgi:type VI secretion system FHA domain protein|nr:type VI secretion system-associated FHA domain protein TagH [Gammaproteobacteria bacterium]